MSPELLKKAAGFLPRSKKILVFTGAGISTESGIPDFRSPGGVWSKYKPEDYTFDKFMRSAESRKKYWLRSYESYPAMRDAKPNAGHLAIAVMEKAGRLLAVVTQNIEELHQRAGNTRVIELHGTAMRVSCLECGKSYSRDFFQDIMTRGEDIPDCNACGGYLKPATISFGQSMPEDALRDAFSLAEKCDACLAVGSSLVVHPAASVPVAAKRAGAPLIIVNQTETALDSIADVVIPGKAGDILPELLSLSGILME